MILGVNVSTPRLFELLEVYGELPANFALVTIVPEQVDLNDLMASKIAYVYDVEGKNEDLQTIVENAGENGEDIRRHIAAYLRGETPVLTLVAPLFRLSSLLAKPMPKPELPTRPTQAYPKLYDNPNIHLPPQKRG